MARPNAAKHGYAAFAAEEVVDAKRRRPAAGLEGYAASRELEFKGRGGLAGFRGALPAFPEYAHNLMRVVLPGGRFGILFHELLQTHLNGTASVTGTFHGVTAASSGGWVRGLIPNRTDLPVVGGLLNAPVEQGELTAFEAGGAWAPATTGATLVPETIAPIGELTLTVRRRAPFAGSRGNLDLEPLGAPGWRAAVPDGLSDASLAAFLTAVAAPLSALAGLSYARVAVDRGTLVVRRNGYLTDPAAVDEFSGLLCALADGLEAVGLRDHRPAAFAEPLPPWPYATSDRDVIAGGVPAAWADDIRAFAARHGLALEDPAAWHRAFPSVPAPGRAVAVMRGPAGVRVLLTSEIPLARSRAVRAAIAFPTPAADTPPAA